MITFFHELTELLLIIQTGTECNIKKKKVLEYAQTFPWKEIKEEDTQITPNNSCTGLTKSAPQWKIAQPISSNHFFRVITSHNLLQYSVLTKSWAKDCSQTYTFTQCPLLYVYTHNSAMQQ